MFNKIQLIGRLAKENTFKSTANGIDICENTLALNKKTKDGEKSIFIKIVVIGKVCSVMRGYTNKGDKIGIIGELDFNSWTDKSGNKKYEHSVIVEQIELLGSPKGQAQSNSAPKPAQKPIPKPQATQDEIDEIPF